jgi:hypothetical protein
MTSDDGGPGFLHAVHLPAILLIPWAILVVTEEAKLDPLLEPEYRQL